MITAKYKRKSGPFRFHKTEHLGKKTLAFGYDQQSALADPNIKKAGKQNKRRQTKWRKLRRISNTSRKRNRK